MDCRAGSQGDRGIRPDHPKQRVLLAPRFGDPLAWSRDGSSCWRSQAMTDWSAARRRVGLSRHGRLHRRVVHTRRLTRRLRTQPHHLQGELRRRSGRGHRQVTGRFGSGFLDFTGRALTRRNRDCLGRTEPDAQRRHPPSGARTPRASQPSPDTQTPTRSPRWRGFRAASGSCSSHSTRARPTAPCWTVNTDGTHLRQWGPARFCPIAPQSPLIVTRSHSRTRRRP